MLGLRINLIVSTVLFALITMWYGAGASSAAFKAYGKREINAQLRSITFRSLHFRQMPLQDVIKTLVEQARVADYEPGGLNIIMRDLEGVTVTIDPPIDNLPLKEVLDLVSESANEAIGYQIENFGIVFGRRDPTAPVSGVRTRWFKVNFEAAREKAPALMQAVPEKQAEALRELLAERGVQIRPATQVFLNLRLGRLMARGPVGELEKIEAALQDILFSSRRVNLELRFAEVPAAPSPSFQPNLALDAGVNVGKFRTPTSDQNGIFSLEQRRGKEQTLKRLPATNCAVVSGRVGPDQFKSIIKIFQQKSGVDLLTFPSMFARDGEPALFQIGAPPLALENSSDGSVGSLSAPHGPSVIATAKLADDKDSVHLAITGAVKELVGYNVDYTRDPQVTYLLRQIGDTFDLPPGHTAVLGIGPVPHTAIVAQSRSFLSELPFAGQFFRTTTKVTVPKNLWFFITPTAVAE